MIRWSRKWWNATVTKATGAFLVARANIVLLGFLAIAAYFLIAEHWAHTVPLLTWSLLLASLSLVLVFARGGQGQHRGAGDHGGEHARQDELHQHRSAGRP